MRALQLGHSGHEGTLGHVALHRWHERLLIGGVQWLGELDRLQRGQATAHAVDNRHALCLSGGQALRRRERRGQSQQSLHLPTAPQTKHRAPGSTIASFPEPLSWKRSACPEPGTVVHACNPNTLQRIERSRPA
jgi:hypothetical protein